MGSTSLHALAAIGLPSLLAFGPDAQVGPTGTPPILAVTTTEGPDRVFVRRSDAERLDRWARDVIDTAQDLVVLDAEHQVSGDPDSGPITVETRLTLLHSGPRAAAWSVPVGAARDLGAKLDGLPVPIEIEAGSREARIWVEKPGQHDLRFRRLVDRSVTRDGAVFELPINIVADAQARFDRALLGASGSIVGHRGRAQDREDVIVLALGPVDRLQVRWASPASGPSTMQAVADAALLWDALPAGDRVRARMTLSGLSDRSVARIELAPGTLVRSATAPGLFEGRLTGTDEQPVWEAALDPGRPEPLIVSLDLWRPITVTTRSRSLPRVRALDVSSHSVLVGLRRPGHWEGRLTAGNGTEAVTDEAFARAWGAFPSPALTLAGAVRASRDLPVRVDVVPTPPRATISPRVGVSLEEGRALLVLEARLDDIVGTTRAVELGVPAELNLTRASGDGLTAWDRPTPEKIRLRFDGIEPSARSVRVEGWLPLKATGQGSAVQQRLPVPWPSWGPLPVLPAELIIQAPLAWAPRLEPAVRSTTLPRVDANEADRTWRMRVDGVLGPPGDLVWWPPVPSNRVVVRAGLTLYPNTAELDAVLDYQPTREGLTELTFSLPRAWSEQAIVEVEGASGNFQRENLGELSLWTCKLRSPLWGSSRVRVRGRLPTQPGDSLAFPDVLPWGRGQVTTLLAVNSGIGRPLQSESDGIEPIATAATNWDEVFGVPVPKVIAYRVTALEGWHWSVTTPDDSTASGTRAVVAANYGVVLDESGGSQGIARLALLPGDLAPELLLDVPPTMEVLGAAVDGAVVPVLRAPGQRTVIPLDRGSAESLELVWREAPTPSDSSGNRFLHLPGAPTGQVPTSIIVHAPESLRVAATQGPVTPTTLGELRALQLEIRSDRLIAAVRGSGTAPRPDVAKLLAERMLCEALAHQLERALSDGVNGITHRDRARAVRGRLATEFARAGLGPVPTRSQSDEITAAPDQATEKALPTLTLPDARFDFPRVGTPHAFYTNRLAPFQPPVIAYRAADQPWSGWARWLIAPAGAMALAVLWPATRLLDKLGRRSARWAATLLVVAAVILQPIAGALAVLAFAVGRGIPLRTTR